MGFLKTVKNSHISVVDAPIELIFWPRARFLILWPPCLLTFFHLSNFYSVNLTNSAFFSKKTSKTVISLLQLLRLSWYFDHVHDFGFRDCWGHFQLNLINFYSVNLIFNANMLYCQNASSRVAVGFLGETSYLIHFWKVPCVSLQFWILPQPGLGGISKVSVKTARLLPCVSLPFWILPQLGLGQISAISATKCQTKPEKYRTGTWTYMTEGKFFSYSELTKVYHNFSDTCQLVRNGLLWGEKWNLRGEAALLTGDAGDIVSEWGVGAAEF